MIKTIRNIDWVLLICLLSLAVAGLMVTYMADGQAHPELWQRNMMFFSAGLLVFTGFCFVPLQVIERISWPVYGFALVLLVMVIFFGNEYRGAIRHFDLGVVNFHPADLMQWALILALAWWFSNREVKGVIGMMVPLSLVIIPMTVLFVLPNLGENILLLLIAMAMMVIAKEWRLLAVVLAGGATFMSLCWYFMHAYQKHRFLTFFDSVFNAVPDYGRHFDSHFNYEGGYGLLQLNLPAFGGSVVTILAWGVVAVLGYCLFMVVQQAQSRFSFILSATISLIVTVYVVLNAMILSGYVHAMLIIRPYTAYNELALVFLMAAMGIVMRVAIESKENV